MSESGQWVTDIAALLPILFVWALLAWSVFGRDNR